MTIEHWGRLTAYQRREIAKLTDDGWTVLGIRRLQDDLNPWASLDMRSPQGEEYLTAVPVSKAENDHLISAR